VVASRKYIASVFLAVLAVAASAPVLAQSGVPAFTPRDERPEDFPAGAGRDETFYACTACHGFKLVAQQGMNRRQWEESVDWMTKRHNMPPLEGNERKIVLDYLTATYPPQTRPGGWQNPFLR
jgi:mono/diheme cytochrome c family protein